jgi:hypothetical protein
MSGGTIGGNTGFDDGEYTYSSAIRGAAGGVFIDFMSGSGTIFTKTGGTIYGKIEDRPVNNEAVANIRNKGHAVYWEKPNTTAGLWINGDHTGGNLDASDESSGWDPQVTGVTVSSPVISAAQGDNVQFASTVDWYREGSRDVTWQLNGVDSPGATSGGSSIGASGLLSVGANETAPTLTVTAVSVADPLMSGSTSISVIPPVVARTSAGLYIGNASTPVNSTGSLAAALAYIRSNAVSDTSYTIVLGGNETVSTLITLDDAAVNNAQRVGVTLEGLQTERTITTTSYYSIFDVRSSITLTLGNNITLKGMTNGVDGATEDSYNPVVRLTYGGKLVMLEGSKITGNTYTSTTHSNGAGVTVGTYGDAAGTFEMRGGEISGNTITSIWGAGGVYVKAGTFVMSGGVIRGNTATNNYSSGGVAVGSPALAVFEKTGGIIYGVNPERAGYNAADNNTATGTGTKANAVLWEDSSSVHSIDGDLAGNFPLE